MPAERLAELVEARVAKIAARLLLVRVARPPAVLADDRQDRQLVTHGGVELHGVHAEGAVAVQYYHLLVGLGDLCADAERHPDAHGSECTRIDAVPRRELRDRLAAVVEDLLAVDAQDAIAVHEVTDLLAQPQRVNRRLGRGELLLGLRHLLHVADAQALAPCLVAGRRHLALDGIRQLLERCLRVGDHADVEAARRVRDLGWVDVDAYDLCCGIPARRSRMPDHVVHARADHDDQICVPERRRPRGGIGMRVVLGDGAAALRRRVERNARRLYECLHLSIGLGPEHARSGDQHGLLGLDHEIDDPPHLAGARHRPRPLRVVIRRRVLDLRLFDLLVEDVPRHIEVDRPGLPVIAWVTARWMSSGMRLTWCTRSDHLVHGLKTASWSMSWNAPRCQVATGAAPPSAMTGVQSAHACAMPVRRLVTPGPEAAMQNDGRLRRRE